jgi:hypothetical protein
MNIIQNSESWFSRVKQEHKGIFFELDILLKALDRFFYAENLPIPSEDLRNRDFYNELNAVRDVVFRVLGILEVIIPESNKNAYWFQRFTESKFLSDRSRDIFRENLYKQDSPEKAVYILYDLFINLKSVVTDLLKAGQISYPSFTNIGQLMSKEIRENKFLNPFRKDMNPDFDVIINPEISEIARSIEDREVKKHISLLYLYLFRLLRYLDHVDITSQNPVTLHTSLLMLVLVRSEINVINKYLKKTDHLQNEDLKNLLKSIAYQFSMETKRVYVQELREVLQKKSPGQIRGKIENSQGILKNLIEQSIMQIVQFFRPRIQGKDIFVSFTTKLHQSVTLREAYFVLLKFLVLMEAKALPPKEMRHIFESMKNFMRYFENSTFKWLRYDDYDEFVAFFTYIFAIEGPGPHKILEKIHNFRIFLETALRQISVRAELKDMATDIKKADKIIAQYLHREGSDGRNC